MKPRNTPFNSRPELLLLLLTSCLLPPAGALAQDSSLDVASAEGSAYGRVRHLEGEVTVEGPRGARAEDLLGVNAAVVPGDRITTLEGRIEVQLADGSLLRLDRGTTLDAAALTDVANPLERRTWLQLTHGSVFLYVEGVASADEMFRLDTPSASVYFLTAGVFRVDASAVDGRTTVTSHSGVAEAVGEGISVLVRTGERSDIATGRAPSEPRAFHPFRQDEFDRWNRSRQGAYVKPYGHLPAREVPQEVTPYVTELAYYGDWQHSPEYGWIWQPAAVGPDWSPYYSGWWDYTPGGWVWVSYEPWGWAPYRYGRWHWTVSVGWFWVPGSIWSGGWVSWGWAPGYVGWCPLNYYNHPAYCHGCYPSQPSHPHRSWVFVPQDQVASQGLQRVAAPAYRTEELVQKAVLLDQPPASTPAAAARIAGPPDHRGTPAGNGTAVGPRGGQDGQLVSFRTMEGRGQARREPPPAGATAGARAGYATTGGLARVGDRRATDSLGAQTITGTPVSAGTRSSPAGQRPAVSSRAGSSAPGAGLRRAVPPAGRSPSDSPSRPGAPAGVAAGAGPRSASDRVVPYAPPKEPTAAGGRVVVRESPGSVLRRIFISQPGPSSPTVAKPGEPAAGPKVGTTPRPGTKPGTSASGMRRATPPRPGAARPAAPRSSGSGSGKAQKKGD